MDSYIQVVSADGINKNMQTFENNIGGVNVHAEAVALVDNAGLYISTLPVSGTFFQATQPVSGPVTNSELRSSNVNVAGTFWQATQPISGTVNVGNFPATQPISGSVNIGNFPAIQPVSGTVTSNQGGTWNIGTLDSISGRVKVQSDTSNFAAIVAQTNASNLLATVYQTNASNFLSTVSGTVGITANSTVDVSRIVGTTVDVNSGTKSAGTQRVVIATDQPQLTNKLLVTPDVNSSFNLSQVVGTTADTNSGNKSAGTLRVVLATDQPALTNKLLVTPDSNIAVDLARIQGQASVASVAGVLDVTPRKRTASTGLSPTYVSGKINTSTTTHITQSTVYLSSLHVSISAAGTTWAVNVTDRQTGSAGPLPIIPNFVVTSLVGANNPITLAFDEPIICTSGINVITVGGAPGNIAYFATYWQ